jgi:hypothetical protein
MNILMHLLDISEKFYRKKGSTLWVTVKGLTVQDQKSFFLAFCMLSKRYYFFNDQGIVQ